MELTNSGGVRKRHSQVQSEQHNRNVQQLRYCRTFAKLRRLFACQTGLVAAVEERILDGRPALASVLAG